MKYFYRFAFLLAALLIVGAGRASADSLITYTFTGAVSASFELPVNPVPTMFDTGVGFQVTPTDLTINGAASNDYLIFYSAAYGGAFGAFGCGSCTTLSLTGPQLYSGPESSPTMLPIDGGMVLMGFGSGMPGGTITTSTPEPSAIVLLGVGMLALVGMGLVSKRSNSYSVAS